MRRTEGEPQSMRRDGLYKAARGERTRPTRSPTHFARAMMSLIDAREIISMRSADVPYYLRGHKILAKSAAPDEYMTAFHCAIWCVWLRHLLMEVHYMEIYPHYKQYVILC